MRAAVLESADKPIVIRDDVDLIEPRAGEIRLAVHFCGLCHSDYSFVNGSNMLPGPIVLGHEAAGVVDAIGPGVTSVAVGDRVVMTPIPACGRCYYCQRGEHTLCDNSISLMTSSLPDGVTGLSIGDEVVYRGCGLGALAEYAIAPANAAVKVADDVPLEVACVLGCAVQTGVGAALNTADVEAGATALVIGLGGIGIATIQGLRLAGASKIIAVDPVAERREAALTFGATDVLDPATITDVAAESMALTDGIGVDYAFECAGKAALAVTGINATRRGGTTVCVGAPALEESILIENAVIFTAMEKKLCGCLLGSCQADHDISRMINLWKAGKLDLEGMITSRRPLEEVNEGFADMGAGKGIRTVIRILG